MSLKELRAEQSQATVAHLVKVATKLFVARGYAKVTIGQLAKAAKVTSGAIYHHFEDKQALFAVVAEQITKDLVSAAAQRVGQERDPWKKLCAGIDAVLESSGTPNVKLAFLEAPVVLGLDRWRQLEQRHTAVLLTSVLEGLVKTGELTVERAQLLGNTLRGLMLEAAMTVAEAKHPARARRQLSAMIQTMVTSLRQTAP